MTMTINFVVQIQLNPSTYIVYYLSSLLKGF